MPIRLGLGLMLDRSQSLFGAGTPAGLLLGREPAGFALDFARDSALIRWPSNPAGQYSGNIAGLISAGVLSFSRASTATYFDADGVMQTASNDVLRRTYDPSTLAALGYLPEPQRTNSVLRSQEFDNAAWSKARGGITADQAVAPDGTTTADLFVETTDNGVHGPFITSFSVTGSTTYTFSCFYKKRDIGRGAFLQVDGTPLGGGNVVNAAWDLDTGAKLTSNGALVGWTAKNCGNGLWRFSIAFTPASSGNIRLLAVVYNTALATVSYTGDGTSGLYLWGGGAEVGAYPTSYIPTTSSTVTRAADALSADLGKLPFSSSVGSLIAAAQPSPDTAANGFGLAQLDDGTDANRIALTNGPAGSAIARAAVVNSDSTDADISSAINAAASRFKQALAWAANDIEMVVGGVASTKDTSCAVPSGLTTLRIGSKVAASTQWSAPIGAAIYIPRRLSQGELIARTV